MSTGWYLDDFWMIFGWFLNIFMFGLTYEKSFFFYWNLKISSNSKQAKSITLHWRNLIMIPFSNFLKKMILLVSPCSFCSFVHTKELAVRFFFISFEHKINWFLQNFVNGVQIESRLLKKFFRKYFYSGLLRIDVFC